MCVVWLFIALWIDMCFGIKDAMLYVRCMFMCVCVEFRMQALKSHFL